MLVIQDPHKSCQENKCCPLLSRGAADSRDDVVWISLILYAG